MKEEKQVYTFRTKFEDDFNRNGEKCVIIEDYGNGMALIRFLKDNKTLKIYTVELEEY